MMKRPASVTEIKTDDYLMSLVDGLRALYEVDVSTGAYRTVTQGCVPSVAGEPLKEGNDFFADLGPTSIDKASIVRALASSTFAEYPVTPAGEATMTLRLMYRDGCRSALMAAFIEKIVPHEPRVCF